MYGIYQCINNENPIRKWVQVMIDFHDILDCMNKHQQINSDKVFQRMVRCWQQDDIKSRILLQSCCGPRSTAVLDWAWPAWFSFNPKIHTEGEYRRREHVQKQFIEAYNKKNGHDVPVLATPYELDMYFRAVKSLEDESKGSTRCRVCFIQRMKVAAQKIKMGYDYFTTTLPVSLHKNSRVVNEGNQKIEDQYRFSNLPMDFKK